VGAQLLEAIRHDVRRGLLGESPKYRTSSR
jgi:hypothetical protein